MKSLITLFTLFALFSLNRAYGQSYVFNEDFEDQQKVRETWTFSRAPGGTSNGWKIGKTSDNSNASFAPPERSSAAVTNDDMCGERCDKSRDRLITPAFDLSESPIHFVLFEAYYFDAPGQNGVHEQANILLSEDDGKTWKAIYQLTGDNTNWVEHYAPITGHAGQSIRLCIEYNDGGGWMYGMAVDNFSVVVPDDYAVEMKNITMPSYVALGAETPPVFTVQNRGLNTVESLTITWQSDKMPPMQHTFTGLNLATFETRKLTHPISFILTQVGSKDINLKIEAVNNQSTNYAETVEATQKLTALTEIPTKRVVLEDFTGAWCGFCPRSHYYVQYLTSKYDFVYGVAVHQGDDMAISDALAYIAAVGVNSYPTLIADRSILSGETGLPVSNHSWEEAATERAAVTVPVDVRIRNKSYDSRTRTVTFDVEARFVAEMEGPFRFNAYVLEDSVRGSGKGYDQSNYYNSGKTNAAFINEENPTGVNPFFNRGEHIVGYAHNHTLRAMLGGPWGVQGDLSDVQKAGSSVSYTFTYTVPEGSMPENMHVLGLLKGYNPDDVTDRPIINAEQTHLMEPHFAAGNNQVATCADAVTLSSGFSDMIEGATYEWKPSTGLSNPSVANPTASPKTTTTYTVTATAGGKTYTDEVKVVVAPTASFLSNQRTFAHSPAAVTFVNLTPNPANYSFVWNFGDGESSTEAAPTHTYQNDGKYNVSLVATNKTNATCSQSLDRNEWIEAGFKVGRFNAVKANTIQVYPNPTDGLLYIAYDAPQPASVTVSDVNGRTVRQSTIAPGQASLDLSALTPGIYFLQVQNDTDSFYQKLMVY